MNNSKPMKVVMIASEMAPFSKAGGLADVTAALPYSLNQLGVEIVMITPGYGAEAIKNIQSEFIFRNIEIKIDNKNILIASYKKITTDPKISIYFVCHYAFFGKGADIYTKHDKQRFYFFDLAALKLLELLNFQPDIIHCHDWHAAGICQLLKTRFKHYSLFNNTKTLLTIHNLAQQGTKSYNKTPAKNRDRRNNKIPLFDSEKFKNINFLKRGILSADKINTVSERYAQEILTPEYGCGLDPYLRERRLDLLGITNGIDYQIFSPMSDPYIKVPFDHNSLNKKYENKRILQKKMGLPVDKNIPVFGIASRITEQKGFDLLLEIALTLLTENNIQIIGVGSSSKKYRRELKKLMRKFPEKISLHLDFSVELASQIYAGSDMFLMPSHYEPCGLGQLISLRYGSIPIVRNTGGLADTIEDFDPSLKYGNGFVFNEYTGIAFLQAIIRALTSFKYNSSWEQLVRRVMQQSFSWEIPTKKYLKLYQELTIKNK